MYEFTSSSIISQKGLFTGLNFRHYWMNLRKDCIATTDYIYLDMDNAIYEPYGIGTGRVLLLDTY